MPDFTIVRDLKYAARTFLRQPGFFLVALLTLRIASEPHDTLVDAPD